MEQEFRFVRVAPVVLCTLAMLVLVIAGVALAIVEEGNQDLSIMLILGGLGVGVAGLLALPLSISRRVWRLDGAEIEVRQGLWVLPRGMARVRRIALRDVAAVERTFAGTREVVRLRTGQGVFSAMIPAEGAFAQGVVAAVAAAQGRPVALREALGFWAGGAGIAVLVLALLASLAISAAVVMALADGAMGPGDGGAAGKGLGLALALPFGLLYGLYRVVKRRAAVRAQNEALNEGR